MTEAERLMASAVIRVLTPEELEFCRLWSECSDATAAFLMAFADARLIPERFVPALVTVLVNDYDLRLEMFVQCRMQRERISAAQAEHAGGTVIEDGAEAAEVAETASASGTTLH